MKSVITKHTDNQPPCLGSMYTSMKMKCFFQTLVILRNNCVSLQMQLKYSFFNVCTLYILRTSKLKKKCRDKQIRFQSRNMNKLMRQTSGYKINNVEQWILCNLCIRLTFTFISYFDFLLKQNTSTFCFTHILFSRSKQILCNQLQATGISSQVQLLKLNTLSTIIPMLFIDFPIF